MPIVNAALVLVAMRILEVVSALKSILDGPEEAPNERVPDFMSTD